MRNIRLLVEYEGTDFSGWQRQKNEPSVQQFIEEAAERVFHHKLVMARLSNAVLMQLYEESLVGLLYRFLAYGKKRSQGFLGWMRKSVSSSHRNDNIKYVVFSEEEGGGVLHQLNPGC